MNITVPIACTLSSTSNTAHTATIEPGIYEEDIGTTTLKAICNDANGFAIYAAGYTGNVVGDTNSTKLIGANTNQLISTGIGTSGDSQWAMKLATDSTATYPITIESAPNTSGGTDAPFADYHIVPTDYTKVATRLAATDAGTSATGSILTTTYAVNIASTQAADTYTGKVIYTLVHPNDHVAPVPVSKNLYYAITGSADNYTLTISDSDITSGAVASGPVAIDGYEFDEDEGYPTTPWYSYADQIKSVVVSGTVAPTSTSYWFYNFYDCESWDLSGLRTDHVTDMSNMFYYAGSSATTFTLDLSSWDTSSVTNMSEMFYSAGSSATTFTLDLSSWDTSNVTNMDRMFNYAAEYADSWSIGDLSSWDTSNVTDMSYMFANTGTEASTWSIGDLSSWDTSSVTNMSSMFVAAGRSSSSFTLNLSSWDTSNVTDMSYMFDDAGYGATTWSVGDLSSWDTSNVTNMDRMFNYAGYHATTFTLDLSSWDTSSVTNMSSMFYNAGRSATTFTLDLSSWDTSSVTNMSSMFYNAGYHATTWSVTIPKTNGAATSPITNTTSRFYGGSSSVYATPPSGRSFTLAN